MTVVGDGLATIRLVSAQCSYCHLTFDEVDRRICKDVIAVTYELF